MSASNLRGDCHTLLEGGGSISKCLPTVDLKVTEMSCNHLEDIWYAIRWSCQPSDKPPEMSSERYRWMLVDDNVTNFNDHRASTFYPDVELEANESMIPWYGQGSDHINIGLPHYAMIYCRHDNSSKMQNLADVSPGIMIFLKVVKSTNKEKAIEKDLDLDPKEAMYGKGTRVLMEITKTWHGSNHLVTRDAYFESTMAALALKKESVDFIGNAKQCNAAFLKMYLTSLILSKHGDCHVLALISEDTGETELVAMTWLDCNRQDFVGTVYGIGKGEQINCKHACQLNKSSNALPNNIIIKVDTPKMIKQYYMGVGTINFHNRVRINEVLLECNILTKD
jgi:hypothetical protein